MRFVTMSAGQLGAVVDDTLVDLPAAAQQLGQPIVADMMALIASAATDQQWRLALDAVAKGIACSAYSDSAIRAPLQPVRNIICIGKNYLEHITEVADKMRLPDDIPEHPIVFTKATTAINHPGAEIPSHPEHTSKLDYEGELALVIGKGGRDIAPENAWDHVFGYSALNDVSARDLQLAHSQWFIGKSLDGFAPFGPAIVPLCAMPEPADIQVQTRVNGELRQDGRFNQLIFDVPTLISTVSAGITLLPGDIIATGTPSGVGIGFTPSKYLRPGDEVVVDVTGVGSLRNTVS
ncbi:MAG: fumarylacetoacetate hydrolase family protein [Porticoccaceae bacterium]|nr:fumarylacetoacetate hydrolase family protein [Pseudomonadales bacterium]MCP5172456.1 fumarylacetoacetate hydrolase family protein [Pseudomonadales bacterium]